MQRILVQGIVTAIRAVNAKFVLYYGDMFAISRPLCGKGWNRSDSDDPLDLGYGDTKRLLDVLVP